jgi:hypothetical protein
MLVRAPAPGRQPGEGGRTREREACDTGGRERQGSMASLNKRCCYPGLAITDHPPLLKEKERSAS